MTNKNINIIEKNGIKYYRWWQMLEELPDGWRIDKTCGSPLFMYNFCISGSILKGGKRALVKISNIY